MKPRRAHRLSLCPETLLTLDLPAISGAAVAATDETGAVSRVFTRCHNCSNGGICIDVLEVPRYGS